MQTFRVRKLTEKGSEYTKQLKQQRLVHLCQALEWCMDKIQGLINDDSEKIQGLTNDASELLEVQTHYKKWLDLYDQFIKVNGEVEELLTKDLLTAHTEDCLVPDYD